MSFSTKKKQVARERRHHRVRKLVRGTAERPRLAVFRSNKHITAQVIDDIAGRTLADLAEVAQARGGRRAAHVERRVLPALCPFDLDLARALGQLDVEPLAADPASDITLFNCDILS